MRRVLTCTLAGALALAGVFLLPTQVFAGLATGHDNSTASSHTLQWTHGDPNAGLVPGFGSDLSSYYYLKAYTAGSTAFCEIYSGGEWQLELDDANKNILAATTLHGTGGRVYITNAVAGREYQCRIANIGTVMQKDYAEFNSGPAGNTTTSDCGGPGLVVDPNFDEAPMEPAPTAGMPTNGCSTPSTVKYVAGDPRTMLPPSEQFNLGYNTGSFARSFTTNQSGDVSAALNTGSSGTCQTLSITNTAGAVVNGPKWGAQDANPKTMCHGFNGVDAGVLPAGTYVLHYSGPSDSTQRVWAMMTPHA